MIRLQSGALACSFLLTSLFINRSAEAQRARPKTALILLSIDGMMPSYVLQAKEHGLRIPNLQRIFREGVHATSVRGVLPTVTYPSHTTMLTGVWPAKHGIAANETFDPLAKNKGGWYWYAEDIRKPTLWTAAGNAGYTVGSVSWPVSVAARGVRYLIPEFWRAMTPEDLKLLRALSTPGMINELSKTAGPYTTDLDDAIPGDRMRTRYAEAMIKQKGVDFLTLHFAALDHIEHQSGPFSVPANAALEEIDSMVGQLRTAIESKHSGAITCIVSDHGFVKVDHLLHLTQAFVQAGFIKLKAQKSTLDQSGVADWTAEPWLAGGSAAIILRLPADEALRDKVREFLQKLASDETNGIAAILDRDAIRKLGGTPEADFFVDMRPGYALSGALGASKLVESVSERGTHGYSPSHPELAASFFATGSGLKAGTDIGAIDMRSVAPTIAQWLGVKLPDAELPPLKN